MDTMLSLALGRFLPRSAARRRAEERRVIRRRRDYAVLRGRPAGAGRKLPSALRLRADERALRARERALRGGDEVETVAAAAVEGRGETLLAEILREEAEEIERAHDEALDEDCTWRQDDYEARDVEAWCYVGPVRLNPGVRYDVEYLRERFAGWHVPLHLRGGDADTDGYRLDPFFRNGVYLGPDCYGIEPVFGVWSDEWTGAL